jgi:7-cyano-7-deazaguanine synthase in queuosine biosynthesis
MKWLVAASVLVASTGASAEEIAQGPCETERSNAFARYADLQKAQEQTKRGAPRQVEFDAAMALVHAADIYKACLLAEEETPVRLPTNCHSVPGNEHLWQCDACREIRSTGSREVPGPCKVTP